MRFFTFGIIFFVSISALAREISLPVAQAPVRWPYPRVIMADDGLDANLTPKPPYGDFYVTEGRDFHYFKKGHDFTTVRCSERYFDASTWIYGDRDSSLVFNDMENGILVFHKVSGFVKIDVNNKTCGNSAIRTDEKFQFSFQKERDFYLLTGASPETLALKKIDFQTGEATLVFDCAVMNEGNFCKSFASSIEGTLYRPGATVLGFMPDGTIVYYSKNGIYTLALQGALPLLKTLFSPGADAEIDSARGKFDNPGYEKVTFAWWGKCEEEDKQCLNLGTAWITQNSIYPKTYSTPNASGFILNKTGLSFLVWGDPIFENGRRYYNEVVLNPNSGGLRLPRMAAFGGGPRNLFANEDFSFISYANKQIRPSSELPLQNVWVKVRRFELTTAEMSDNTFVDFPSRTAYSDVSSEVRKQALFDPDPSFEAVIPLTNRSWKATWHSLGQHLVFDRATTSLVLIDPN